MEEEKALKKQITIIAITALLIVAGLSGCFEDSPTPKAKAQTVYVDDDFTSSTSGWGYDHFNSIQKGIDNVSLEFGTVNVASGIYYENIQINKPLTLQGENRENTIIEGSWTLLSGTVININIGFIKYLEDSVANWVNISGFTITNGSSGNAGISVSGNHNTIKDNRLLENNYDGIRIHGRFNNIIENEISNNSHNAIALGLDAEDNTIVDNTITNNGGFGILIWSGRNVIENNVISSNLAYGIYLDYGDRNVIENNTISSNFEYGIYIDPPSVNNSIYHNNFVNHTENAYDNSSNTWDNGNEGNYWDDYGEKYPDATQINGIWDTPYNITGDSNQDRYPLMNLVDM